MPDLLVKLYELPNGASDRAEGAPEGVTVRRPMAYERHVVLGWVREVFGAGWASECEAAFGAQPIKAFVAVRSGELLGFACYDCTRLGFFGPIGVAPEERTRGVGRALLLATLRAMAERGYGYAVIGGAGSTEFYVRTVGAIEIPGSSPGVYPERIVARESPRRG